MSRLSSVIITAAAIGGMALALQVGVNRSEAAECHKWAQMATERPDFYLTIWQAEQCATHHIKVISKADYIATLAVEAPETLRPPERAEFVNENSYRAALARYALLGYWATEQ